MAERRMFAKSIVLSDAFLDMPLSSRCLYFTLGMLADDDGFVGNPKAIMRQCGATQDDMLVLLQKRFLLSFESGVIVIKHWRMNNYLRTDRHTNTNYIEEYSTLTVDEKGAYTEKKDVGIPLANQRYTEDRLVEDNVGKCSVGEDNGDKIAAPSVPISEIVKLWNEKADKLSHLNGVHGERETALRARWKEHPSIEWWGTLFDKVNGSAFLTGDNDRKWKATFDWLMKPANIDKVCEGRYDDTQKAQAESKGGFDVNRYEQMLSEHRTALGKVMNK